MPANTIRFYFDYISHNAYLAWTQLPPLAEKYGFAIDPIPVLFAGLLEAHNQLGPAEVPAKLRWMTKNVLRKAALLGVPLNVPVFHPFNPLLALRVSLLPIEETKRHALISALFQAVWARGLHVSEPAVVEPLVNEIGLEGSVLLAQAQRPECKARLRELTNDAIARGVFGVPSMEVDDELFWGYDDLPYFELLLAGKDPLDRAELQKWLGPQRPSAMRRQFRSTTGDT